MFVKNYKTIRKFLQLGYFKEARISYADIMNKLGGMKNNAGEELNTLTGGYERGFYTWHSNSSGYNDRYLFAYNKNNIFNLTPNNYKYGINSTSTDYYSGLYLALGNGSGEISEDNYTLFSSLKFKEDYEGVDNDKIVSNLNEDGIMNQITLTYCFKALKDITVTETGLMHSVSYSGNSSSPSCKPYLLSHELLDEPMTFTEGELFSITYTVEIPIE